MVEKRLFQHLEKNADRDPKDRATQSTWQRLATCDHVLGKSARSSADGLSDG